MKKLALLLALTIMCSALPAFAEDVQIGYVNTDTKVYMDASEKAIVDGSASLGTQVRIEEETLNDGIGWYRVTFLAKDKVGWVKADDVDLVIAKKPITAGNPAAGAASGGVQPVDRESDFPVLKASGIVDESTLPGGSPSLKYRTLDVGDSGDDVKAISERLFELGYLDAKNAVKLTKAHQSAVKQFQKVNGLVQDGLFTPELQAKLFSSGALNKKGKALGAKDAMVYSNGKVKADNKKGGGTITYSLKNASGQKIDAFDFSIRLYNTYGERFLFSSVSSDVTLTDELTALNLSEERATFNKNETIQFSFGIGNYYFAGVMIAITAYHNEKGETVRIPEDQLHWFGFGKGVEQGYQPLIVTPLSDGEKQLAEQWKSGIEGLYVDAEIAKAYNVREGYLIQKMEPGSMMDAAGLKAGDILLAIGDVRIFSTTTISRALSRLTPGAVVTVLFLRNGTVYQTQMVTPGGITAA